MSVKKKAYKNPYIEARRENLQILRRLIEKEGEIPHKKLLGIMGMYGLTQKTITSHLETLENAGFIKFKVAEKTWKYVGAKQK